MVHYIHFSETLKKKHVFQNQLQMNFIQLYKVYIDYSFVCWLFRAIICNLDEESLHSTLKEHHQFNTKKTISIISDLLKLIGGSS